VSKYNTNKELTLNQ